MSARFFLDTNVLLYCFDEKAPAKAKKAAQLVRSALETGRGVISYQVVQEFFNVAFRRFAHPMSVGEAEQYLVTVLRPLLAIHSSPALYFEALRLVEKYRTSWYDSLIIAAAIEGQCDRIYSEDFQNGRKVEGLHVENPFV